MCGRRRKKKGLYLDIDINEWKGKVFPFVINISK